MRRARGRANPRAGSVHRPITKNRAVQPTKSPAHGRASLSWLHCARVSASVIRTARRACPPYVPSLLTTGWLSSGRMGIPRAWRPGRALCAVRGVRASCMMMNLTCQGRLITVPVTTITCPSSLRFASSADVSCCPPCDRPRTARDASPALVDGGVLMARRLPCFLCTMMLRRPSSAPDAG